MPTHLNGAFRDTPTVEVSPCRLVIPGFILAMKLTKRIHRHKHAKVSDMLLLSLSIFARRRSDGLIGVYFFGRSLRWPYFLESLGWKDSFEKVQVSIHSEWKSLVTPFTTKISFLVCGGNRTWNEKPLVEIVAEIINLIVYPCFCCFHFQ